MAETSRKERLRFHRIITKPSYVAPESPTIKGYINRYNEFKKYDLEPFTSGGDEYAGPAPKVFIDVEGYKPYTETEFVIDGLFVPFDRTIHNLDDLSSRIYILETSGENIYGRPLNALDDDDELRKKYELPTTTDSPTITFYINPTNLKLVKRKFFQQIRTRAGWAFQHWGPQIGEINLEGTTGNITPPPQIQTAKVLGLPILPYVVEEVPTEQNSPALAAFRELESWYDEDQGDIAQRRGNLIVLEYRGRTYVGHFAELHIEERGTNPFQLYYRIRFLVHYDTGNLADATRRARSQIVRNEETIEAIRSLKEVASEDETVG